MRKIGVAVCLLVFTAGGVAAAEDAKTGQAATVSNVIPAIPQKENSGNAAATIEKAEQLEKAGDTVKAFDVFRKWLDAHPDSVNFAKTLLHTAQIAPTTGQALTLLQSGIGHIQNPNDLSKVYAEMAATAELSGDIEHAQQYYETAYIVSPSGGTKDYESLLHSAQLLFELGRIGEAGSRADVILSTIPAAAPGPAAALHVAASLLMARIAREKNGALAGYLAAAPLIGEAGAGPAVYLFVIECAHKAGKPKEAAQVFSKLQKEFGSSPEVALAASVLGTNDDVGKVGYLPTPSRLLTPLSSTAVAHAVPDQGGSHSSGTDQAAAPQSERQSPGKSSSTAISIAVQTGAFRDQANAQTLANELSQRGYHPTITPSIKAGISYYRVIIPVAASADPSDAAKKLLDKLKSDGFDGFIVPN